MRNRVIFLFAIVLLYLIPSLILQGIYGPSFGFLSGEDCWQPDGEGGWVRHGEPSSPPPDQPSVNVPLWVYYIPIFLPGMVLFLFLFTPLSRHLDSARPQTLPDESAESDSEGPAT
ncbi:MAG: hypothetical protein AB1483_08545 [Candidatus Zixiibacteriota bacterium]